MCNCVHACKNIDTFYFRAYTFTRHQNFIEKHKKMLRWVVVLVTLCCISTAEAAGVESFILTSDEDKFGSRATDLAASAVPVPTSPLQVVLSGDTTSIEIYTFTLCNVTVVPVSSPPSLSSLPPSPPPGRPKTFSSQGY